MFNFGPVAVFILGAIMLIAFINMLNEDREKEGKKPLGCIATLIIAILVITFWALLS